MMKSRLEKKMAADLAENCGFSHWGFFSPQALRFLPEVREMCSADRCGKYNKRWTCPPACGSLEEISRRAAAFPRGILLQTTGQMEDAFDAETLVETMQRQARAFDDFLNRLKKDFSELRLLPMSSGGCELCEECTWPDSPCRFPDRAIPSMEAYGLLVSEVCQLAGIPYYYGKNTITFTSCILFE